MLSLSPGLGPDGLPSPGSGYHHMAPVTFGNGAGSGAGATNSGGASADAIAGANGGANGGASSAAGGASELMHQLAMRSSTGKSR